ncbi:MAG: hypothetical protein M1308_18845 [Actinobacteria bacterium]|nr:hypothetical protein [Actinomycetota bacterium]MCL5072925.1 hypothetical protein [Actinomycetota bacterium]
MKRIILISCVKEKLKTPAKAKDLYVSDLFKKSYRYAQLLKPGNIFILSAKYGLLEPEQIIEPYDETLKTKSSTEIREWSKKVIKALKEKIDLEKDEVVILTGNKYYKYLLPYINNYKLLLGNLPFGSRLSFLKKQIEEYEQGMHQSS